MVRVVRHGVRRDVRHGGRVCTVILASFSPLWAAVVRMHIHALPI